MHGNPFQKLHKNAWFGCFWAINQVMAKTYQCWQWRSSCNTWWYDDIPMTSGLPKCPTVSLVKELSNTTLWKLTVCVSSFRNGPSGEMLHLQSRALQSLADRDFALLSWIASGADNQGHTCCYLSQEAKNWGSLSIGPFWPRPNCVIGFLSGRGFTASYWEWAYSRCSCPTLSRTQGKL